jgi:hypothetical protein
MTDTAGSPLSPSRSALCALAVKDNKKAADIGPNFCSLTITLPKHYFDHACKVVTTSPASYSLNTPIKRMKQKANDHNPLSINVFLRIRISVANSAPSPVVLQQSSATLRKKIK